MFKIPARVLPPPSIIDYDRYYENSVIPGFGRRLMTLAERDAKYPVLAGFEPGADIELDLDDRRARQAIEDQVVALIDPVPIPALMRVFDLENIEVAIDFDGCTIPLPPKGCSVREAIEHYIASTPAPAGEHATLRTLPLSRWRDYKPKWQSLSRDGQAREVRPEDGALIIHVRPGGSEPVAGWYRRCLRETWDSFALHRFVADLDAGRLVLAGLPVAGHSSRAQPVPRQWWRARGVTIDLNAGTAGPYERYKVVPEWVELTVARGGGARAGAAEKSTRRNWAPDQIREAARAIYGELGDDPPNMERAETLIRERLPGASRDRIRPVLNEPEFGNQRRRSGERRNI